MWRRLLHNLAVSALAAASACASGTTEAPAAHAPAVNQLAVAGNACGPAALLNAFRCGSAEWRSAYDAVAGEGDRAKILTVIREAGMRPSPYLGGKPRWSRRGVSVADLRDMGGELAPGRFPPRLHDEVFFRSGRESPEKLFARVHKRLERSLSRGLPPVLSLRRHVWRAGKDGKSDWVLLDAHFVTITALPRKLAAGARSFPVSYVDPWGGRRLQGNIHIPARPVFADGHGTTACLVADFPGTSVGKRLVRRGEISVLVPAAAIGRW